MHNEALRPLFSLAPFQELNPLLFPARCLSPSTFLRPLLQPQESNNVLHLYSPLGPVGSQSTLHGSHHVPPPHRGDLQSPEMEGESNAASEAMDGGCGLQQVLV